MNRKIVFVLLVLAIALSSCKTERNIAKEPIKEYGSEYLFEKMKENELQYNTISFKADIRTKINRKKSNLNATVRIYRDSLIWVSISPGLGLEAARVLITQDSLFFMNRITKEYMGCTFSYITNRFKVDVDFNMLQSLLLGNDFSAYENNNFKAAYDNGSYRLNMAERAKQKKFIRNNSDAQRVLVQSVWLNTDNFKINQIRIRSLFDETRKLDVFYDDFQKTDSQWLTTHVVFDIVAREKAISKKDGEEKMENQKIKIELNFSKIELNPLLSMPFSVPLKYQRVVI